jgi:hypothetical protein
MPVKSGSERPSLAHSSEWGNKLGSKARPGSAARFGCPPAQDRYVHTELGFNYRMDETPSSPKRRDASDPPHLHGRAGSARRRAVAELRHCVRSRCSNPALIRLGLIGASGALEASAIPRLKFAVASAITIPKSSVAQHCAKSKV